MTKAEATVILLESYRTMKRNCKSLRLLKSPLQHYCRGAKGWVLLIPEMTVIRRAYPAYRENAVHGTEIVK